MAGVVLRAASVGSGSGAGEIVIVSIAEASAKLSEIACQEAEKLKEKARNDDNKSNIPKQFLDNAISSIRKATFDQYNIVICTDYERDDFQGLQGQILLLKPIDVEVKKDELVNFKVYIFDTGRYIRYGRREKDDWSWWGESKIRPDAVSMQVYFENAQPKKNADDINALMDKQAVDQKAAADADAAKEAAPKAEAERKVIEEHQTENDDHKEKDDDDVDEVSDDVEEASDDVEEASEDEEEASEDEDARSEDL